MVELYNLSISNNYGEWRRNEASSLAERVQQRFMELQNPSDCASKKKIICDLGKACGYGCQIHHVMYCFITAFYTNRTMILLSEGWRYNTKGFGAYFKPVSETCQHFEDDGNAVEWNGLPLFFFNNMFSFNALSL